MHDVKLAVIANCGHRVDKLAWVIADRYSYTKCLACSDRDSAVAILYAGRLEARVTGWRVVSLTGLPVGTVVERVSNDGARTPTKGKYKSDRMTVQDIFGNKWYANGPKNGLDGHIILRRAEACL